MVCMIPMQLQTGARAAVMIVASGAEVEEEIVVAAMIVMSIVNEHPHRGDNPAQLPMGFALEGRNLLTGTQVCLVTTSKSSAVPCS
jgi:hypothetical protein